MEGSYDLGPEIGRGQWGVVYRAHRKSDALAVAVKKVRCATNSTEGVNFQVLREMKMLRGVVHAHVVRLFDVFNDPQDGASVWLVFELMASDLEVRIRAAKTIDDTEARGYASGLLKALAFLHDRFVLHRDVKPANLLLSHAGEIKLADFGASEAEEESTPLAELNVPMSYQCCTLWYRPPELLFGASDYADNVDAWSAGCVIAEINQRKPLFRGESEIDQLAKIFQVLGTPTDSMWPGVSALRKYARFSETAGLGLRQQLPRASNDLVALVDSLLKPDPRQRAKATSALEASLYFAADS